MRRLSLASLAALSWTACSPAANGGAVDSATPINAPYFQGFDGTSPLDGWLFYNPSTPNTPPAPNTPTLWAVDGTPEEMPGGAFSSGVMALSYGTQCLNYNNGSNYATGGTNKGAAITPKINIGTLSNPVLYFRCNYETESTGTQYDQRWVKIGYLGSNGQPVYLKEFQCSYASMGSWHDHLITMESSWGNVRIGFGFDTIDGYDNDHRGWFVDDVTIQEAGSFPIDSIDWGTGVTGSGTPIYGSDFEGDAAGWTFEGNGALWNVDASPTAFPGGVAKSGVKSLNYNNGTNYDSGQRNWGAAKSPAINLSGVTNAQLKFQCNYQTETTDALYDQRFVKIYSGTNPVYKGALQLATTNGSPAVGACSTMGTWHEHSMPLNPAWGEVKVEFFFDTVNSQSNNLPGWAVDDVVVLGPSTDTPEITPPVVSPPDGGGNPPTSGLPTGTPSSVGPAPYTSNFDSASATSGWTSLTAAILWDVDATPSTFPGGIAKSGSNSLNYNDGTDYDNGQINSGTVISPSINLTGSLNPKLKFQCNYQTEDTGTSYDLRFIEIYSGTLTAPVLSAPLATVGGSPLVGACAEMGTWHEHTVALDPAWGEITVHFGLDTVDELDNDQAGWAIDDFAVSVDAPGNPAPSPVASTSESKPADESHDGGCGGSVVNASRFLGFPLVAFLGLLVAGRRRNRR